MAPHPPCAIREGCAQGRVHTHARHARRAACTRSRNGFFFHDARAEPPLARSMPRRCRRARACGQVRPNGKRASYKLTSTIMLRIATDHSTGPKSTGELRLSGSMTRQQEQEFPAPDDNAHLPNMGRMVEQMENTIRDSLKDVYFGKTKATVNKMYNLGGAQMSANKDAMAEALKNEMKRRGGS